MIEFDSKKLIDGYLDRADLDRWLDEVQRANEKFNLYSRHFQRADLELLAAESLIVIDEGWVDNFSGPLLDVGSGWGIPSVPILLAGTEVEITLAERSRKKADFLLLLFHRLHLKAEIFPGDLLELAREDSFSQVIVRGVALDKKICDHLEMIVKPRGELIYFGSNFPERWGRTAQSLEYSIDNLPARNLIKYIFA